MVASFLVINHRNIAMKYFFCVMFVFAAFINYLQAAEPRVIELKGHSAFWYDNTGDDNSNDVAVAFSPDSKRHVTVCGNGTILLWDAETGKELEKLQEENRDFHEEFRYGFTVAFSKNGKNFVVSNSSASQIWEAESGRLLHKFAGGAGQFSMDGEKFVLGDKGTVRIFDVDSGKELRKFEGGDNATFSHDGKKIITAKRNSQTILILDAESGKELLKIEGSEFILSPDGKKIVSWGVTGKGWETAWSAVWDAESGKKLLKIDGWAGALSPDGKKIITRMIVPKLESVIVYVESGKEQYRLLGDAVFLPDGKRIIAGAGVFDRLNTPVRIFDAESGKELQKFETSQPVYPSAISSDGRKIALVGLRGYVALLVLEE